MKGYSGSLQARLLFLRSENMPTSTCLTPLVSMRCKSRIYIRTQSTICSARYIPIFNKSIPLVLPKPKQSEQQPFICLKAYRQLTDLNIRTGSLNGVSDCLERLTHYQAQIDSVAYNKDLAQIENVDKLRKTIRDSEVAEAEYYRYRVFYCWIIVIAFTVILILMSISIVLQRKKICN